MSRVEQSVFCFKEGFSCSQAILSAFCSRFGLDRETALRISQPFGGGIAHMGLICGAVSGAFMVIGLKHGRIRAEDVEAREKTYALMHRFEERFRALHGSTNCTELLGCHIGTPEGMDCAKRNNLFETRCSQFVRDAAAILENLLPTGD